MHHDLLLILITIAFTLSLHSWFLSAKGPGPFDAKSVLEKHGMSVYHYLPSIDQDHDDKELIKALDDMSYLGKIILDKNGDVVGGILSRADQTNKPFLRLVVDNS